MRLGHEETERTMLRSRTPLAVTRRWPSALTRLLDWHRGLVSHVTAADTNPRLVVLVGLVAVRARVGQAVEGDGRDPRWDARLSLATHWARVAWPFDHAAGVDAGPVAASAQRPCSQAVVLHALCRPLVGFPHHALDEGRKPWVVDVRRRVQPCRKCRISLALALVMPL